MSGPLQPTPFSAPERTSNWIPIGLGIAFVVVSVGTIAWFARSQPKPVAAPPAYAANLKLSDRKTSSAQDFVGTTATYLDGTITNTGNQTVTRVMIHVVFQDSKGHPAQVEDVPLQVLQNSGSYPEFIDLRRSPLAPGQSKSFRLTFEHLSGDWNQAYPDLQIADVTSR